VVVLGGGAGVEHLAELYWRDGKPVVPVWAQLIFDSDKLPTHFWARSEDATACVADYLDWFDRYVEVGPLVT
jgi:hypothetical protein